MSLTVIALPTVEPITLADARLQCSIDPDITKWDALLLTAIKAARARAEHITQRHYAPTGLRLTLDAFPCADFALGAAPVTAIQAIQYIDRNGAQQTVPTTSYLLDTNPNGAAVLLASGATWPTSSGANSVSVDFTAGFVDRAALDAAHPDVTLWMLGAIATAYRQREHFAQGVTITELPGNYAERLLDSARRWD